MKHALILDGVVVDVASTTFPVHESLFWVACDDEVVPHDYEYLNGNIVRTRAAEQGMSQVVQEPPKTPEQIQKDLTDAVQRHLDNVAKTRGYDGILSACSYAAHPNPFQSEGIAALNWRAAVWVQCYQVLDAVKSGAIEIPTAEQLVAGLPPINW